MTTKFLTQSVLTLGLTVVLLACGDSVSKKEYKSPDEEFGELFKEVQLKAIFPDSKTFADASPKGKAEDVMKLYEEEKTKPNFNLKRFVMENFTFSSPNSKYVSNAALSPQEHINELWSVLTRKTKESSGTLIPLVKPYLVQSGAASETYYWDNYFMMLGLQAAGKPNSQLISGDTSGELTWLNNVPRIWLDKHYYYPIPTGDIITNPNLKQNPGW